MKITVLTDLQEHAQLQGEFGLSLLLDDGSQEWLFDLGAGDAWLNNMRISGMDPQKMRPVILSHGHYDHTGGLAYLQPCKLYCCRGIVERHYSWHIAEDVHDISMPDPARAVWEKCQIQYVTDFAAVSDSFYLTGPIPRRSFEDCGGKFFHDRQCTEQDFIPEEQALLTRSGVVITGCCHAGIINTLEYCRQRQPDIRVHTVVGGLHLRHAPAEKLQLVAEYLQKIGMENLYLLHCTGDNAITQLQQLLPGCKVKKVALGETLEV